MTEAGKNFFRFSPGTESYVSRLQTIVWIWWLTWTQRVPQFHVREVGKPAPGSIHLAQNHECFVNEANTVLSFQGHPEINSALARKMLLEEDDVYTGNSSEQQIQEELLKLGQPTDGTVILRRIVEWVDEWKGLVIRIDWNKTIKERDARIFMLMASEFDGEWSHIYVCVCRVVDSLTFLHRPGHWYSVWIDTRASL